jgi:XRE family aerobic/anaerobic benzoate catabolism transcriptional regulator
MIQQEHNIGHIIKVLRAASGLKQKDLAKRAEIKANYLSLVEAGKRDPSLNVLRAIAKALNVPISMLFWESESLPEMSSMKEDSLLKVKRLLLEMEALRLADQRRTG